MNRASPLLTQLTASAQARLDDPKNAAKGDWIGYRPLYCLWLLIGEIWELAVELYLMWWFNFIADRIRYHRHRRSALEEAGDVVVCFMMLLNVLGVIREDNSPK